MSALGNNLKMLRAKYDLTQEDLANKIEVSRKTIGTIERNVYIPSTFLALKLARVLNVTVEEIFFLVDEN